MKLAKHFPKLCKSPCGDEGRPACGGLRCTVESQKSGGKSAKSCSWVGVCSRAVPEGDDTGSDLQAKRLLRSLLDLWPEDAAEVMAWPRTGAVARGPSWK